jgi:aminoglycoside 6'-N-acetyltransferase I
VPKVTATWITIQPVRPGHRAAWLALRLELWPDSAADDVDRFYAGLAREPLAVLVAEDAGGELQGFVELSIRAYAEGCDTDHVAYVEGWYVRPAARRQGLGAALIAAAEAWGREQGATELASDSELANDTSHAAHRALGFEEVSRVVCWRKAL